MSGGKKNIMSQSLENASSSETAVGNSLATPSPSFVLREGDAKGIGKDVITL